VLGVAEESVEFVDQADGHLGKAIKNNAGYKFYLVCWFMGLGILLLLIDLLRG
jgi:hypothetical protein